MGSLSLFDADALLADENAAPVDERAEIEGKWRAEIRSSQCRFCAELRRGLRFLNITSKEQAAEKAKLNNEWKATISDSLYRELTGYLRAYKDGKATWPKWCDQ